LTEKTPNICNTNNSNVKTYANIGTNKNENVVPFFLPINVYFELIKTKQTFLLIYTGVLTYLISSWKDVSLFTLSWLIISLFFSISGSTLLNMYIDQDIDRKMERTKNRALASGKIAEETVLGHGIVFTISGIMSAVMFLNVLTGLVILLGAFFDVIIYSYWLKRRTRFSILFGGIAGALPAVAGRTSAINKVDSLAIMFGVFILAWIPMHILTLALIPENLEGYKLAEIPMWPVVKGKKRTIIVVTLSSIISAIITILISISLKVNITILILACFTALFFIVLAIKNLVKPSEKTTWLIFKLASMFMVIAFLLWFLGIIL